MNPVIDYYTSFGEKEWTRLDREPLEFYVNLHWIRKSLPPGGRVLDNGAGPGKYATTLAAEGYRMTLTDLTPRMVELARNKARELGVADRFDGFHVKNATRLDGLENESFDASLLMGPLYHLQSEQERSAAVSELHRVTKPGGTVAIAIRSRQQWGLNAVLQPEWWKPLDTMDGIAAFRQTGRFDHPDPGRYTGAYFFDLAEVQPYMEAHGFETTALVGSGSFGMLLGSEQWRRWEEQGESDMLRRMLLDYSTEPSILGISPHLLYIGVRRRHTSTTGKM